MPQYAINTTPVSASGINTAMYRGSNTTLSMNDRYSRIYTKTGFNTQVSYGNFLNTPGFNLQAGRSATWFMPFATWDSATINLSANFPGIQTGDPFTVVAGSEVTWSTASPVTHHGFIMGQPNSIVLVNGSGGKRWHTTSNYDGGDLVTISGYYCCDSTSSLFGPMFILALRFGINQTGYAAGDGNSVSGSQTGLTVNTYTANYPQNTTLNYTLNPYIPPDPGPGCFLASATIIMADGSQKPISQVKVGEQVQGGFGTINTVTGYHKVKLGNQPVYTINNKHVTTQEHRHFCVEGWAAINTVSAAPEYVHEIHVDNEGTTEKRKNKKFTHTPVVALKTQMHMHTVNGPEQITSIEPSYLDPDQYVYTLVCDGSHTHVCDDVIVSAWARDDDWDYVNWKPRTGNIT